MGGINIDTDSPREKLHPSHERVSEVAQSCLTLCDPVDCSPPGSSIHGILQARILEWVAISFSRGSSPPRDRTQVSRISCRHFNLWATREAPRSRGKEQWPHRRLSQNYLLILEGLLWRHWVSRGLVQKWGRWQRQYGKLPLRVNSLRNHH